MSGERADHRTRYRWQWKSGRLSSEMRLSDFVNALGWPWPRIFEAWDRALACWVVYEA